MFGNIPSILAIAATLCVGLLVVDHLHGSSSIPSSAIATQRELQSTPSVPFTIGGTQYNDYFDTTSDHFGNCGSGPVDSKNFDTCSETCSVGWTAQNEWLVYDFEAASAGEVDITVSISSFGSNKIVAIDVDGSEVGTVSSPGEGWGVFRDRVVENVPLSAGSHQLKIRFISGNTNLCSISIGNSGPSPPTPQPTPAPPTDYPTTRIKMYHEQGYWWQCDNVCDDTDDTQDFDPKWCFQCDGNSCDDGEFAKLRTCDESGQNQNTMFELVPVSDSWDEVKIRAANTNLCLTTTNYQDTSNRLNTKMRPCDDSDSQVWWTGGFGTFSGDDKFEVHPRGDSSYCLTTQHHPKDGEDGRVERCAFARKDVSNWWIKYSP